MSNSPAVVCEGHVTESNGDKLSSDEVLFREKRGISKKSDVEVTVNSDVGADKNQPHSSQNRSDDHHKETMKKSLVVMPDRKSYYINVQDTSNWINGTTPTKLITLSHTVEMWKKEYDLVLKQFTDTMRSPVPYLLSPKYQVQKIEKVVNGWTLKRYKDYCRQIRNEASRVNEKMLFHGTVAVRAILDTGFDERHATRGGLYGFGVYFSPLSWKSDRYTYGDANGEMHMFLCRVALGKVYRSTDFGDYSHPPPGYNSVEGNAIPGTNDPIEMVVYIGEQAYPEYLITYNLARKSRN